MLLFLMVCLVSTAACASGAYGMHLYTQRTREIAEREDPRDTQIRDLQATIKIASVEVKTSRTTKDDLLEHVNLAHARIHEMLEQVDAAKNTYISANDLLKAEITAREDVEEQLSVVSQQLDTFKQRANELELELKTSKSPGVDMLDPGTQADDLNNDLEDDTTAGVPDDFHTPSFDDASPSLIQSLTGEVERWRHHCQVLGGELKNQREKPFSDSSQPVSLDIDELTEIRGIGKILARKLHELGIYRYRQLLSLTENDVEHAAQSIPDFKRRMTRDAWAEQARYLHLSKYQESI